MPRHPPCALISLTNFDDVASSSSLGLFTFSLGLTFVNYLDVFSFDISVFDFQRTIDLFGHGLKWTRTTDLTLIRRAL